MSRLATPLRKNDNVLVITGKDRGKRGRILKVLPGESGKTRLIVEGVNMIKRHTRPNPQKQVKGGIVEREAAIHASNVMLVDPDSSKPTRVGKKTLENKTRVRISRRSGSVLDK
jgi:large subunit ribosomal protein L24